MLSSSWEEFPQNDALHICFVSIEKMHSCDEMPLPCHSQIFNRKIMWLIFMTIVYCNSKLLWLIYYTNEPWYLTMNNIDFNSYITSIRIVWETLYEPTTCVTYVSFCIDNWESYKCFQRSLIIQKFKIP